MTAGLGCTGGAGVFFFFVWKIQDRRNPKNIPVKQPCARRRTKKRYTLRCMYPRQGMARSDLCQRARHAQAHLTPPTNTKQVTSEFRVGAKTLILPKPRKCANCPWQCPARERCFYQESHIPVFMCPNRQVPGIIKVIDPVPVPP